MALSCPEPDNYAAIAKQLHETALEAENRIFVLEQQLRAAVNRPTLIQTSTATENGIPDNVEYRLGPGAGSVAFARTFDNTGVFGSQTVDATDWASILGEGLYDFGIYTNVIPSTVVNDNSDRLFRVLHLRPDPSAPSGVRQINQAAYMLFESNTGVGVDVCLVGTFKLIPGDFVEFILIHTNTLSTLDSPAGRICWMHKSSDATVLSVV